MERRPDFALDTNALIHALKGAGRVRDLLTQTDPARIAIPAIAAHEIEYGTLRGANPKHRRKQLRRLFEVIEILPFDGRAAERTAQLRMKLESRGEGIGPFDSMIAGTALAFGCTLVTHNTAEFSRVPGLALEDWY